MKNLKNPAIFIIFPILNRPLQSNLTGFSESMTAEDYPRGIRGIKNSRLIEPAALDGPPCNQSPGALFSVS